MNSTSVLGRGIRPAMLILAALFAAPAAADFWFLPETTTYLSADRFWRLTVIPRDLTLADDQQKPARGIMESFERGQWRVAWERSLCNDVSPVDAIVSSSGQAVTFDNWHRVGRGRHVVVIYDAQGEVVRTLTLDDFLPEEYIRALPHTVSSTYWSGEHGITADGKRLLLRVIVPYFDFRRHAELEYVEVAVDLASGRVIAPRGMDWTAARVRAWMVNALSWL